LKKTYIDITQLYEWKGKVTGIQRVMDEISKRFIGDERFSSVFIVWNKNTASFYEVDLESFLAERRVIEANEKLGLIKPNKRAHYAAKGKQTLKRVYHHVPLSRTMYNTYSSLNSKMIKAISPSKVVNIEEGSTLFMPHGGVWESDTYITEILELKKKKNVKLAAILFDLCPVLSPQFVVEAVTEAYENYMKRVLPKADLVLSISENTAKDAHVWLKQLGEKDSSHIEVFRLGDEVGAENPEPAKVPKDFILCVGTVEARKNHTGLYYAYKLAVQQGRDLPTLVIAGRKGWMAGDIYQLMTNDPDTKNKFRFLHNASDDQLSWLYKNALFSIYPSFYEGWGLPIAESLLRGTPCLASETSSMPEIAGELVDYFSPYSPEQIKNKIEAYIDDPEMLKARRKQIKEDYKATTWDTTYKQVTDFLLDRF
jgi:glycosyltransferase involved in cell wall biosynthesis